MDQFEDRFAEQFGRIPAQDLGRGVVGVAQDTGGGDGEHGVGEPIDRRPSSGSYSTSAGVAAGRTRRTTAGQPTGPLRE